jgi:hypothetical protein
VPWRPNYSESIQFSWKDFAKLAPVRQAIIGYEVGNITDPQESSELRISGAMIGIQSEKKSGAMQGSCNGIYDIMHKFWEY